MVTTRAKGPQLREPAKDTPQPPQKRARRQVITRKEAKRRRELFKDPAASLHIAAFRDNREDLALLLEDGVDANAIASWSNNTALEAASQEGNDEIIKILLRHGAKTDIDGTRQKSALLDALVNRYFSTAKLLILNGASVNVVSRGKKRRTPLHEAAKCAHWEIVSWLLARGAPVDARDYKNSTPLHECCYSFIGGPEDRINCIEKLVSAGADVDALDCHRRTPLHKACETGNYTVVSN